MNDKKRATASPAELVAEVPKWHIVIGLWAVVFGFFALVCAFVAGVAWNQRRPAAALVMVAMALVLAGLFLVCLAVAMRELRATAQELARRIASPSDLRGSAVSAVVTEGRPSQVVLPPGHVG